MATTTTTMAVTQTNADPLSPSLWTTPQELCLLQSLTRFKPVGIHKHFRMLAIQSALLSSGTIPHPVTEHPHVSSTPGIWRKLGSLYDLRALDEREDAIFADTVDDDDDDGEKIEYWREFELPADGFEAEMWGRRLATGGGEEEAWSVDGAAVRERESTVAESEDPRSSPVDAGSVRGTRSFGRRAAAGRRLAEVKQEESGVGSAKGGSRRTSKAASPAAVGEDTEMQDVDGREENEESSDDEDAESDQEATTEDDRKSARLNRGRGGRRARGRRGRRGK